MNWFTRTVTAPAVEPLTATEVKTYTHISHAVEDDLIAQWIKAARITAEIIQHRALCTQTLELVLDCFPGNVFYIPRPPLQSIESIIYYDTADTAATFADTNYYVDAYGGPGRVSLNDGVLWPTTTLRPINGVIIQYKAGYGVANTVPENVKQAIYLFCAYCNENRSGEIPDMPGNIQALLRQDKIVIPVDSLDAD